jgi:hypothetical protein
MIEHWAPRVGLVSTHHVGIQDEYRAGLPVGPNWLIVRPGDDLDDDGRLASLRPARQLVTELLAMLSDWAEHEGGPADAELDGYRDRARKLGLLADDDD